jgi:hypothetical protein
MDDTITLRIPLRAYERRSRGPDLLGASLVEPSTARRERA